MAKESRRHRRVSRHARCLPTSVVLLTIVPGCNALLNGWLDPTVVGSYHRTGTTEIRTALTLEDTPSGIPGAAYPAPEDSRLIVQEYPISGGDTLAIEINELRQRQTPYQAQAQVSASGYVNLPVVGRVRAVGKTVPDFEEALRGALQERNVLLEPEVTVNPLFLQKATYSIFGIGVSAANNAPLRAGTFPIRRPDLRLLEAINQVGGLNEFVTEIYIFRHADPSLEPEDARPEPSDDAADEIVVPDLNLEELEKEADEVEQNGVEPDGNNAGGRSSENPQRENRPTTPQDELYRAVADADPAAAMTSKYGDNGRGEIPPSLEPDPTQPFIYVNREFVPNPAYTRARRNGDLGAAEPPPLETISPASPWAKLAGDATYRVIVVPAESLRAGELDMNIFIRAGDVIRIVSGEIGIYFVMGQVNRIGAFAFNSEPITLKGAIAAAGGLSGLAWPDRCTIYRQLGKREQMIQVNLDRIFAGQDPDFYVKRGDLINVGTHPFAPFLQRIRGLSLPNPITNVGYSFTYARNFADLDSFAVKQNPANEPDQFPNLFP